MIAAGCICFDPAGGVCCWCCGTARNYKNMAPGACDPSGYFFFAAGFLAPAFLAGAAFLAAGFFAAAIVNHPFHEWMYVTHASTRAAVDKVKNKLWINILYSLRMRTLLRR